MVVLIGVSKTDDKDTAKSLADKISKLRIFNDDNGKMNKNIQEINGEVLVVSQFTLYADTKKGNRPSFIRAAKPATALPTELLGCKDTAVIQCLMGLTQKSDCKL